MLNDCPTVLAVICPLFDSNIFLSSSDQLDGTRTLCSYIFAGKPERILGNRSYLSACIYYILYKNVAKLCVLIGNALLIANAQKKNTGSTIRIWNFSSSIKITYLPVAIESRRFGKYKICHIILQEARKQSFGSRSPDS